MNNKILISGTIITLFLLVNCSTYYDHKKSELFFSQKLQDSLNLFISKIPKIDNEYGAPTKTIVASWIDMSGDTIVLFNAHYYLESVLPAPFPGSSVKIDTMYWVGAAIVDTMICPVAFTRMDSLPSFFNKSALILSKEKYDFFFDESRNKLIELPCQEPYPFKIYKLYGKDSLDLLVSKYY